MWIEDGLSAQTLGAYRRDLSLFAQWLQARHGRAIDATRESDLLAYMAERHAATRATTANRRLSVFRRFCRWALREGLIDADPTLKLQAARAAAARAQDAERGAGRGACSPRPTSARRWACAIAR